MDLLLRKSLKIILKLLHSSIKIFNCAMLFIYRALRATTNRADFRF